MILLYPQHPLAPKQVEPLFEYERDVAHALGIQTALVDHDALVSGRSWEGIRKVPEGCGPAVYRGWMLTSSQYRDFSWAVSAMGDGQVSGFPSVSSPVLVLSALNGEPL